MQRPRCSTKPPKMRRSTRPIVRAGSIRISATAARIPAVAPGLHSSDGEEAHMPKLKERKGRRHVARGDRFGRPQDPASLPLEEKPAGAPGGIAGRASDEE